MKKIRKYFRRHRWWLKREWQQFHQDLLLVLARQRYRLVISEDALLGSCCFSTKTAHGVTTDLKRRANKDFSSNTLLVER